MTLKDDRRTLTADSIDRILATVPPGVDRERLRSDVEGIHSLYCTALLELRSVDRRKKIGALIALAKEFKLGLFGERDILADSVGMQYWWFRSHLNRLIA